MLRFNSQELIELQLPTYSSFPPTRKQQHKNKTNKMEGSKNKPNKKKQKQTKSKRKTKQNEQTKHSKTSNHKAQWIILLVIYCFKILILNCWYIAASIRLQ